MNRGFHAGSSTSSRRGRRLEDPPEHDVELELRERRAQAVVDPRPEREVRIGRPVEDDLVGPLEHGGIAVGGGELERELLAARDPMPPTSMSSRTQRSNIGAGVSKRRSSSTAVGSERRVRAERGQRGRLGGTARTSRWRRR